MYSRSAYEQQVRREPGRDLRTRSALRLGEHYQIDFTPDNFWQMHRNGLDMYDIQHLLITHTHHDHFQFEEVVSKDKAGETNGRPLNIYMSTPAHRSLREAMQWFWDGEKLTADALAEFGGRYPLHGFDYYQTYSVGDLQVETVAGNHETSRPGERSINWLILLPSGTRLLYALDTGYYTEETWRYLAGKAIDVLVMDCTFGGRTDRGEFPSGHLDLFSFQRALGRMFQEGVLQPKARIFASHINPNQGLDHQGLESAFAEGDFEVTVAYDGLRVDV